MFPQLNQVPTPDLSVEMLTFCGAVMLAQGQESIWNKTEQGNVIQLSYLKYLVNPFHPNIGSYILSSHFFWLLTRGICLSIKAS